MTTNQYIESVMKIIPNYFRGVYSSDDLPKNFFHDGGYIVNLSKRGTPGSHWITLIVDRNKVCYCDPLVLPFIPSEIQSVLDQVVSVEKINHQIQHEVSIFCGFYAMLYVFTAYLHISYGFLFDCFPQVLITNDKTCLDLLILIVKNILNKEL